MSRDKIASVAELFGTPGYLAPETLKAQMYEDHKGYSQEVDMWACGVIMYTLLAGYAPFYHRRQIMMLRMIQDGKYQFPAEHWDAVSDDAKDLVRLIEHSATLNSSRRFVACSLLILRSV